jgi:hypothetical protein
MRRRDLRSLQIGLADMGVSSLGRAEAHALPAVMAALDAVRALRGEPVGEPRTKTTRLSVASAQGGTLALISFGAALARMWWPRTSHPFISPFDESE